MAGSGPERFKAALADAEIEAEIRRLPNSTRTAEEAAQAVDCTVAEIAKSLVFRATDSCRAVVAIMSGVNRVDLGKLSVLAGEELVMADAAFVRSQTGYAIGGVPPFGFTQPVLTFLDQTLFEHTSVWAAAGSPFTVFETTPGELERAAGARSADLRE